MIGDYQLHEKLGHGGTADLYRTTRPFDPKEYTIKIFHQDPNIDINNEIAVLQYLDQHSFLKFVERGTHNGHVYVILEYLPGKDLFDLYDQLVIDLPWIKQLVDLISRLHELKIVHGDLKPENIIQSPDGKLSLIDFGFASSWDPMIVAREGIRWAKLPRSQGTIYYLPPEFNPRSVEDPIKADVYSLGVTLYVLLTKTFPYPEGDFPYEYLENRKTMEPFPMPAEIPEKIQRLVFWMMTKNPEERPSLEMIQKRLEE